jgi:anti-anti-sigma regulatory factor
MLRITTDDQPRVVTFRLEGRLEGPWVAELEKCWRGMRAGAKRAKHRVDLSGVTFIDAAGKDVLARMYEHGAELVAGDCLIKALVEEIAVTRPSPDRGVA